MKITVEMLQKKNACHDQVELFSELFPDGADVNHENAGIAHRAWLDIDWAAKHFLLPDALAEWRRIKDTALAEYGRIRDTAWTEYQRICAHAFVDAAI